MAWEHWELLANIREEKFVEIYGACSRKIRNMLESMYGKKAKKGGKVSLKSSKNRSAAALAVRKGIVAKQDNPMAEELFKTWLYDKRSMLAAALDFFEIPNEDGITDQDLDVFEQATAEKLTALMEALIDRDGFDGEEVAIYMAFMGTLHVEEVPRYRELIGITD